MDTNKLSEIQEILDYKPYTVKRNYRGYPLFGFTKVTYKIYFEDTIILQARNFSEAEAKLLVSALNGAYQAGRMSENTYLLSRINVLVNKEIKNQLPVV